MTMLLRAGLGAALLASASSDNTYAHSELEWADVVPALSGLKVAAAGAPPTMRPLAPAFSSDQRAYTASVARSVVNISVLPTATCAGCLIDVCVNFTKKMRAKSGVASANVTIPTQVGTNLTIMVTAPWANNSGFSYANYSVNISKVADPPPPPAPPAPPPPPPYDARTDATLRGLSSNPGALSPEFDPHVFEYQLDTGRGALPPSVLIRAAPNSSSATMELNGEALQSTAWSTPIALASEKAAVVVVTNGDNQHAYTIHLHRKKTDKTPVDKVEDWFEGFGKSAGGLVVIAGMGGFIAVGCIGLVMSNRKAAGVSDAMRRGTGEAEEDSWQQAPFYSPGVGSMMDDDGIDNEPTPLDVDGSPAQRSRAPAQGQRENAGVGGGGGHVTRQTGRSASGFEYDRRYDAAPGEGAKDAQAKQWDSRYDGLSIGASIGGEDQ